MESTANEAVTILFTHEDAPVAERCTALSPLVRVVGKEQIEQDPALAAGIQVVYGWWPPERWKEMPRLKWVQVMGAGVDSLLKGEVISSEVTLTNVSGIHAAPITEHMFGMLLAYNRKLFTAAAQQPERVWSKRSGLGALPILEGKTLGLLGVGAIGTHSARVGRAFGMRVIGYRRRPAPHPDLDAVFGPGQLLEFLGQSDVVMNTLPLTSDTRRILGARELAAMREGAILINTGRGGTIDTDALIAGLKQGRPAAALLDVTDPEPLPSDHPLWTTENVVITPHYSGSHSGYDRRAGEIFLDNLRRFLAGEPLTHVVDKQAGY